MNIEVYLRFHKYNFFYNHLYILLYKNNTICEKCFKMEVLVLIGLGLCQPMKFHVGFGLTCQHDSGFELGSCKNFQVHIGLIC